MMRYRDFLAESFIALRAQTPKATEPERLEAWLAEVGALLAAAPLGVQFHWIDMYATVLLVENGGIQPHMALATIKQAVAQAQQLIRWA